MKWILVFLCFVVGYLVERVDGLGGFGQPSGGMFAWSMSYFCYVIAGGLILDASREALKKKLGSDEG